MAIIRIIWLLVMRVGMVRVKMLLCVIIVSMFRAMAIVIRTVMVIRLMRG